MTTIITNNRKLAFCIGLISTIGGWYALILLTQTQVKVMKRQYIGLGLAITGYIVWFLRFCYTVESK